MKAFKAIALISMSLKAKHILRRICPFNIYSSSNTCIEPSREHIVPQSMMPHVLSKDLNNIFVCASRTNTIRGNLPFASIRINEPSLEIYNGTTGHKINLNVKGEDICMKTKSAFTPPIKARGAIARTCLYMGTQYPYLSRVIFTQVISLKTAIKWNRIYPVEEWERQRSLKIYTLGFPRNIFVLSSSLRSG